MEVSRRAGVQVRKKPTAVGGVLHILHEQGKNAVFNNKKTKTKTKRKGEGRGRECSLLTWLSGTGRRAAEDDEPAGGGRIMLACRSARREMTYDPMPVKPVPGDGARHDRPGNGAAVPVPIT